VRFGSLRSDGGKDGSDPISSRRHFARASEGRDRTRNKGRNVKAREIDVARGFPAGNLPRIRGRFSQHQRRNAPVPKANQAVTQKVG